MLYVEMKTRSAVAPGVKVTVGDVADTEGGAEATGTAVSEGMARGIYSVTKLQVLRALKPVYGDEITMLGPDQCYVHARKEGRDRLSPLRAALAFILLLFGSALAITWFHADVGMRGAQMDLYKLLTGGEPKSELLLYLPYALGVGLGVSLYYALIGSRKAPSPLSLKLNEYRVSLEKAEAKSS